MYVSISRFDVPSLVNCNLMFDTACLIVLLMVSIIYYYIIYLEHKI